MPNTPLHRIGAASKYLVITAAVLVFIGWIVSTPPGLLGKADAIAYAVCHRISERSFHIGSLQLPSCARCTGMYLGAVVGLVFQALTGWKRGKIPHWGILAVLIVFFAAFGIDGSNSYLYLLKQVRPGILPWLPNIYIPNNTLRLLTGSGMGLAMAIMLFPAFNQSIWSDGDEKQRAIPGWKAFGLLVGIQLVLDLLVLTQKSDRALSCGDNRGPGCMALVDLDLHPCLCHVDRKGQLVRQTSPVMAAFTGRFYNRDDPDRRYRFVPVLAHRNLGSYPTPLIERSFEWMHYLGSFQPLGCRPALA